MTRIESKKTGIEGFLDRANARTSRNYDTVKLRRGALVKSDQVAKKGEITKNLEGLTTDGSDGYGLKKIARIGLKSMALMGNIALATLRLGDHLFGSTIKKEGEADIELPSTIAAAKQAWKNFRSGNNDAPSNDSNPPIVYAPAPPKKEAKKIDIAHMPGENASEMLPEIKGQAKVATRTPLPIDADEQVTYYMRPDGVAETEKPEIPFAAMPGDNNAEMSLQKRLETKVAARTPLPDDNEPTVFNVTPDGQITTDLSDEPLNIQDGDGNNLPIYMGTDGVGYAAPQHTVQEETTEEATPTENSGPGILGSVDIKFT